MGHEVGGCHETRQHEGRGPGEEAENDENPADYLKRAREAHEGEKRNRSREIVRGGPSEELGGAMGEEEQARHDAERRLQIT